MLKTSLCAVSLIVLLALTPAMPAQQTNAPSTNAEPLDAATLDELRGLYKQLIDAENDHDLKAVRRLVWTSSSTLFVAKTKTAAEGNWAGFWGTDTVMQHFHDLYPVVSTKNSTTTEQAYRIEKQRLLVGICQVGTNPTAPTQETHHDRG